jgi:8-oxo-dGTP diphosphatase
MGDTSVSQRISIRVTDASPMGVAPELAYNRPMSRPRRRAAPDALIRAAGGLVWREQAHGPKLAVVHRPKHQDWSLPKGKLEPGESFALAALREVEEETGCRATLGSFAGYTLYSVKGREKIVLFWNMTVDRFATFMPNGEIDAIAWLSPAQALERLDHPGEREVLVAALAARVLEARHGWTTPSTSAGSSIG